MLWVIFSLKKSAAFNIKHIVQSSGGVSLTVACEENAV